MGTATAVKVTEHPRGAIMETNDGKILITPKRYFFAAGRFWSVPVQTFDIHPPVNVKEAYARDVRNHR